MEFSEDFADAYMAKLQHKQAKNSPDRTIQATQWQQDAIETAKMLNDMASKGIYFRIFKKYSWGPSREGLIKCRNWVINNIDEPYRGRTFVKIHQKFIS